MKPDWPTRVLLFAIALFLGIIAINGTGGLGTPALAQKTPVTIDQKFGHLRFTGDSNGFYMFDSNTGRIWYYRAGDFRARPDEIGQIEEPGARLSR